MSVDQVAGEAALSEPFPGGELTLARAAKLLGTTTADVVQMVEEGRLTARLAAKPGGGEQTLVSFESVQVQRAASADSTQPAPGLQPEPEALDLARRPQTPPVTDATTRVAIESDPGDAQAAPDQTASLAESLDRLTAMHGELLAKLGELLEVMKRQSGA